ncbi:MAG TPA: hypothetical protein VNK95_14690 [Caldilineaceae bacterium]|nr:hypothetical protein [Caldilineaceae bacterium]
MTKVNRYDQHVSFVPALAGRREPPTVEPLELVRPLPPMTYTGHARQEDNAITHAQAALIVSAAYVGAAGLITLGLLLLAWMFRALGGSWPLYVYTGLLVWGAAVLTALWGNRRQSLYHSASGIAHHEIESRERLARHAIDTHARLLLARWELDRHAD